MNKKYYFSIATMFKNESWGMKEWIEHNKLHGVDHIYLIDDYSDDDYLPILQPYIDSGYVTLFHNEFFKRFTGRQQYISNYYFIPIINESYWIANVDIDEFLYSPLEVDLKNVLKKYEDYGEVYANWVWFNSNNFVEHPKDGVVNNFTKRAEYGAGVFCTLHPDTHPEGKMEYTDAHKCIANTNFNVRMFNVHEIYTNGSKINISYKENPDNPELLINHYQLQSKEYWEKVKMHRGDCNHWYNGRPRGWHVFESYDIGDIIDTRLKEQNKNLIID
jgi:hypothetical protein